MVWRGDIEKHYENANKAFSVLNLVDRDNTTVLDGIRDVISNEMKLSCQCVIDWLDDDNNEYSEVASDFVENLDQEYDICVVIDAQNFIFNILEKPLSELLNIE